MHCFFEQSGTFKNEFRKLGFEAYDYDILNDFGETDYQIDLFAEIDKGYDGEASIFDRIAETDLILAFFPCIRFEAKVPLLFRGENAGQKTWNNVKKLEYSMKLNIEQSRLYVLICKLFVIATKRGLQMLVENPSTQPHYLTTYFPIRPSIIDSNRTDRGDYYKKPTQYWFVNREVHNNLVFEPMDYVETQTIEKAHKMKKGKNRTVMRSLIHPQYANRFIREFILDAHGNL